MTAVAEQSGVAEARRSGTRLAGRLGFDETDTGRVALVATELATNLVRHAGGGEVHWRAIERDGQRGLEVIAVDRGPGIADVGRSLRDGHSTAGTPGTGLGAIGRLADRFEVHSLPGVGTAIVAEVWERRDATARSRRPDAGAAADGLGGAADDSEAWLPDSAVLELGAIAVPRPGEDESGDAWAVQASGPRTTLLLVDGLGHGPDAAAAAAAAVRTLRLSPGLGPGDLLERIHEALRQTRGAAVAAAEVDVGRATVRFAGAGNVAARVVTPDGSHGLVSLPGIVGHQVQRIQEFRSAWPAAALLVMHSDGLRAHWELARYPGLVGRHPGLVAAVLYRDHARATDDATVVVARERARTEDAR